VGSYLPSTVAYGSVVSFTLASAERCALDFSAEDRVNVRQDVGFSFPVITKPDDHASFVFVMETGRSKFFYTRLSFLLGHGRDWLLVSLSITWGHETSI
jgi:hypothetical protein